MTRCCRAVALAALCLSACGCLPWRQTEILESKLRQQEDALYGIRSELEAKSTELAAARRELDMLRTQQAEAGQVAIPAEHVMVVSRATGIRFHSLLTRPLDRDDESGDDILNVILTPHDADGETVKLPGSLRLELLDLSRTEGERTVAAWDFDPEQAREQWHSGFIATGYRFELPWPESAPAGKLLLLARLTTHDGRHFETTQEIVASGSAAPGQLVERLGDPEPSSRDAGPTLLEPAAFETDTARPVPTEPPTFELPEFDTSHQKPAAEQPIIPQELPWVDADAPETGGTPEPRPFPAETSSSATPETEAPIRELPALPDAEGLETPFGSSQTEIESPATGVAPVAAPSPFEHPTALADASAFDSAPASAGAAVTHEETSSAPGVVLPLNGFEPSDRKSADSWASAAPVHRIATTIDADRPTRFYSSRTAAGYAPTMVLNPLDSDTRKPESTAGVTRISGE